MIKIYLEILLENRNDKTLNEIAKKLSYLSSRISSVQLTQKTFIFVMQSCVISNLFRNELIKKRIKGTGNIALTLVRLYGYIEEASIAANELKRKNPRYYWALYNLEIEMLYFIIKPVFNSVITDTNKITTDNEVVEILNKITNGG